MTELTKFKNLSVDTSLGGNNASDETISSQKAVKHYIDMRNDIPLGFGVWTDQDMNSEIWGTYTGSTSYYTAALYPLMWSYLNDIVSGTIESDDILAMTSSDLSNLPNLVNAQESNSYTPGINSYIRLINQGISPELALSWFFVVDTTNNVFYVPQNVRKECCVGSYNIVVQKGTTANNGTYEVTSYGDFKQVSHLAKLTKTTQNDYTYYTVAATPGLTSVATTFAACYSGYNVLEVLPPLDNGELDYELKRHVNARYTTSKIDIALAKTLKDTDYKANLYVANSNVNQNSVVSEKDIDCEYKNSTKPSYYESKTTTVYSTGLRVWTNETLSHTMPEIHIIGDDETNKYLLAKIEGQTSIPAASSFTTSKRLYIKIAK